jgi:acetyltransferase-like isoleucine patch superfamily enzyme
MALDWLKESWSRGFRQTFWFWRIRPKLGACGERVFLPRTGSYHLPRLFLGSDIEIGMRPILWAVRSKIVFGDQVMCGPEIVIMAGDHNVRPQGKFMKELGEPEKEQGNDLDVIIEGDVWIGTRAVILKGVHIGRGAVVGAGSVVRRRVPPYSLVSGNPARPHGMRGTLEQILAHEAKLYPPEKRLPRSTLEAIAANVYKTTAVGMKS